MASTSNLTLPALAGETTPTPSISRLVASLTFHSKVTLPAALKSGLVLVNDSMLGKLRVPALEPTVTNKVNGAVLLTPAPVPLIVTDLEPGVAFASAVRVKVLLESGVLGVSNVPFKSEFKPSSESVTVSLKPPTRSIWTFTVMLEPGAKSNVALGTFKLKL